MGPGFVSICRTPWKGSSRMERMGGYVEGEVVLERWRW